MIFVGEMLGVKQETIGSFDVTAHLKAFNASSREEARAIMLQFAGEVMPAYEYREPHLIEVTRQDLDTLLRKEGLKIVPIDEK